MTKSIKKRYLKALNRRLKKEAGKTFGATFVFYPPGTKPKDATGVTASDLADPHALEIMDAVQARVFVKFSGETKST
ncbi:hypothetical protein [Cupriavidus necator]|uniref:hypothetical protein n=1 Tax=Cupriavidus necator TaxID=106590 RepID=UPI0005B36689|nr:hypothetical protein [Cupriavidus necator]